MPARRTILPRLIVALTVLGAVVLGIVLSNVPGRKDRQDVERSPVQRRPAVSQPASADPPVVEGPDDAADFTFAVIGDRTGGAVPGVFEAAIEELNTLGPEFVLGVGDLIEGYSDQQAELVAQWEEVEGMLSRLKMPFDSCPGNHDLADPVAPRLFVSRPWRAGRGERSYFAVVRHGCLFVLLDSCLLPRRVPKEQSAGMWAWLTSTLSSAPRYRHVFVFSHYPLYAEPCWDEFRPLLPAGKTTVFSGHWHSEQRQSADGVEHYVHPGTGVHGPLSNAQEGKFNAIYMVGVRGGKVEVTVRPLGGVCTTRASQAAAQE